MINTPVGEVIVTTLIDRFLQDACDSLDRYPVVSSLRSSTTGYKLSSLQLDLANGEALVWLELLVWLPSAN